ncbi:hypothetical protein DFH06DRAFT_1125254 [Mycena polygramma]|nr:hypothetical protein DFH06DRAFT_1125254 [Mycena polygramma]
MSCGMLDALSSLLHQWLALIAVSLARVGDTIQEAINALATVTSLLLSFPSLIVVSFFTFLFLGGALTILVIWPFFADDPERDEYDECESGLYYADKDAEGRWTGVAIPVIVVDRTGRMNTKRVPNHRPAHDRSRSKRH